MDKIRGLPREQRMLAVAGSMAVFIISLFLTWFDGSDIDVAGVNIDTSVSGWDIDSWWIALALAIVAGGIFAAEGLNNPAPFRWATIGVGALAAVLVFFWTLVHVIDGSNLGIGAWLALIVTAVGAGLAAVTWNQERT